MPHIQGDLNVLKDITASTEKKVSENQKILKEAKAQQQAEKMTNSGKVKEDEGQPPKEEELLKINGHSTAISTNGDHNGLVQEEKQEQDLSLDQENKNSDHLDNNGHADVEMVNSNGNTDHLQNGQHAMDNMENVIMGYQNGLLGLPNGHRLMEIFPSPPMKTNNFLSLDPAIMTKLSDFTSYTNGLSKHNFDESEVIRPKKIYRVVLTGGPCGGKTTGQARLCTFFENLGWKVFRVPEAATVLLSGGIKFSELTPFQAIRFQEELLRTMMQLECVYFRLAETINKDILIICDRGTMDASAFIKREDWEFIVTRNNWNDIDLRDSRYNQIIHMVSAANGAEPFYTIEDHICRSEGLELARDLDQKAAQAWVGHPYFDVVDNSTDFETKLCRMIQCVCQKLGIDTKDRLQTNSRKMKFLVQGPLPPKEEFPEGFQDFKVVHDYLQTNTPKMQARLRKRGQKSHWTYTYTVRRPELQGQVVEVKTTLTQRDYNNMLSQKENNHMTVYKTRRCFLLNDQYFQLDMYTDPCHPRCNGLILLETYSSLNSEELQQRLPKFLNIHREVSGDPKYSMFNLSLKERWENNIHFCQSLTGSESTESMAEILSTESKLTCC